MSDIREKIRTELGKDIRWTDFTGADIIALLDRLERLEGAAQTVLNNAAEVTMLKYLP
jgi:hypothetical protein